MGVGQHILAEQPRLPIGRNHAARFRLHRHLTISKRHGKMLALSLVFPLVLIAAWQASSAFGWLPEQILPAPAVVWATLAGLIADGSLQSDTLISLTRVLRGFALGGAIGVLLGAAMALSPRFRAYVDPLFLAVSQVPIVGWIPLLILLVGIDEELKTIIIALAAFIPVTLGAYQGIRDVPGRYHDVGRVFTLGNVDTFRTIVFPAATPAIFTGLREGAANSWQTLVAVELLASTEGLGYQMAYGRQLFQLELVIASMIVIGAIGVASDTLLAQIERRLRNWQVR
jgi:sulfonate transport system permease protein